MLNQSIIVGRLVKDPELKTTENGNKVTNITLAVSRSYKNIDGEYDTDYIPCVLWKGTAENATLYCKKGDLVGIKGSLQSRFYDKEDGTRNYVIEIVVDKITFLTAKSKD